MGSDDEGDFVGSASDGLGHRPARIPESWPQDWHDMGNGMNEYVSAYGKGRPKRIPIPNGQTVVRLPAVSLSSEASLPADPYASGPVDASVRYKVEIINKAVVLTRPGARGEYVDAFGDTHGDTIYSHLQERPIAQSGWATIINTQYILALYLGPWTPSNWGNTLDVNYQWTPAYGRSPWYDSQLYQAPLGNMNIDNDGNRTGSATGPSQETISLSATDNGDGFSANSKYYLTVHDPVENLRNIHTEHHYYTIPLQPG